MSSKKQKNFNKTDFNQVLIKIHNGIWFEHQ
jgi:hypothetical protein